MFQRGEVGQDKFDRLNEVLGWVNDFIKPTGYVAGTKNLVRFFGTICASITQPQT